MTGTRPLGVMITRSPEGNEQLARRLKLVGLDPIPVDTMKLVPPETWGYVDQALKKLGAFDWVVFTSSTGVKYFGRRMKGLSLALPGPGKPRFAAVGRQTAEALSGLGLRVDFVPSQFTTSNLGDELPASEGESALLLRSEAASPVLRRRLTGRGLRVHDVAIYRTLAAAGGHPRIEEVGMVVFASPSAVRGLCSLLPEAELRRLRKLRAICIGPVTEAKARKEGFAKVVVPPSFTIDGVMGEIRRLSTEVA